MKKRFPAFVKRAVALSLALVLLLALVPALPLAANAAYTTDGWEFSGSYGTWMEGRFHSDDSDLIFEDDQPYDWSASIHQSRTSVTATVSATIKDANGNLIDSVTNKSVSVAVGDSTMISASDFTKLTTDLFGTFTLVCDVDYKGDVATLTKTFSRVASTPIESTITSRSNPDNVFTFADPIDLVLNIKKNDGVAVAYNAAVTVTNASGTEVLAARGVPLPVSTNITLSVKDLVNLPAITTAGTYKVNLTLTDSKGAIQYQTSSNFAVVALTGSVTATVTSATSSNLVFDNVLPDVVVNLEKNDGIAETFITNVTITNSNGSTVFTNTFESDVPATGVATIAPNLANLAVTGTFDLVATVTDDAGNLRASTSATFTRTSSTPMTCTLTDKRPGNTGKIYYSGSDVYLQLKITHKASANQTVTIKAIGTLNGNPYEQVATTTKLGALGTKTVTINTLPSYGVFEDIHFAVYAANGNELWRSTETFSFSRIPTASAPGEMPLLNMNVHYTNMTTDPMLQQVNFSAMAGSNMWRSSVRWEAVEKTQGNYSMPGDLQHVMDQTESKDMQALIILAYGNSIYGDPDPDNSTWVAAYANYCEYVAKMMNQYYPNRVVGFEIWNEWNNSSMSKVPDATDRTGDKYAKVVIAASKKIKAVNPNFKVIGGATSGDGSQTNTKTGEFIQAMLATPGFLDAIDGISFHTYSSLETTTWSDKLAGNRTFEFVSPTEYDFVSRLENFKKYLTNANAPADLEIWVTETSWCTNAVPQHAPSDDYTHITTGVSEEQAAAYMVQLYTWALAEGSIDRIFWYDLLNDCDDDTKVWANNLTECNYGLLHHWNNSGSQPLSYSAKQGYVAMCAMSSKLGGATYQGTVNLGNGVSAYKFTTAAGKTMVVAWTTSDTTKTLRCSGSMTVTDMYGNATSSLTSATLSECPIYIEYSGTLSVD